MPKQPRDAERAADDAAGAEDAGATWPRAQEELKNELVEASAGSGMVTVRVTGDPEVKAVKIAPAAVDPEDLEILADMVLAAVDEALRIAQELVAARRSAARRAASTGGRSRWAGPAR